VHTSKHKYWIMDADLTSGLATNTRASATVVNGLETVLRGRGENKPRPLAIDYSTHNIVTRGVSDPHDVFDPTDMAMLQGCCRVLRSEEDKINGWRITQIRVQYCLNTV